MRLPWVSIIALSVAAIALAGVVTLAFAYENLRRQMAGISSDMARLPGPSASHEHSEARLAVIRSQLSRVEKPIIVMGDSIVESSLLPPSICGHPVINAGIGGATIGFFTRYASLIIDGSEPELVVLSVGINDANTPAATFQAAYLATLRSVSSPVEVVTITPSRSPLIDAASIEQFNTLIKSLDSSYLTIDAAKNLTGEMTTDGIHLNRDGYDLWNKAVVHGIESKIGCAAVIR